MPSIQILSKVRSVTRNQRFDSSETEKQLDISFGRDWKSELPKAFNDQERNYVIPAIESPSLSRSNNSIRIGYIGAGRIVRQRHLPALKSLRFNGEVVAFDVAPAPDSKVRAIDEARSYEADLFVVASPGHVHNEAINLIGDRPCTVLVEKPLCITRDDWEQWTAFATGRQFPIMVCHNLRLKANVLQMLDFLRKHNAGRLLSADVLFQSAPTRQEIVPWLRDERRHRTLLMDYSIHSLDIASLFAQGPCQLLHCQANLDDRGDTCFIGGSASFSNYTVNFQLRQSTTSPRRQTVSFYFQNYSCHLGFNPDTFVPHLSDYNFGIYQMSTWSALRASGVKLAEKLRLWTEPSHRKMLAIAVSGVGTEPFTLPSLRTTYDLLFSINDKVYS